MLILDQGMTLSHFFTRIITNNITLNQSKQNLTSIFKQNTK